MPSSDEQRLLDDVLRDANYAAFRAETYELSRAEFKRGRKRPLKTALLAVAAVVVISTLLAISFAGNNRRSTPDPLSANVTSDLPAGAIATVQSTSLEPAELLRSVFDRGLIVETTKSGNSRIQLVQSHPSTLVEIKDAELLALFSDDSLGFLRSGERLSLYRPPTSSPQ